MKYGLDKLQKELDALTYNSKSVLNALIHSVVTSGSDKGFKSIRAGEEIFLSRIDMYRIYTFYKEWELNNFAIEDSNFAGTQEQEKGFDTILEEQDAIPIVTEDGETVGGTTEALVEHSKILFMTTDNVDQNDESDVNTTYWLGLIKNANNPKLITNTAPIPINLRTPIFDPNMATTRYNQHPTYLFPAGYYNADLLGFSGDGVDHDLDGNSWTIGGDTYVNLESNRISLGDIDSSSTYKIRALRTGVGSLSFGYDSHAQGKYGLCGGLGSFIPDNSRAGIDENATHPQGAIAIGFRNIASNDKASSIGGENNSASGVRSSVLGGLSNVASSRNGAVVAGYGNVVGDKYYNWQVPEANTTTSSDCVKVDPNDPCSATVVNTPETDQESQTILLTGDVRDKFFINDRIRIFDYTVRGDGGSLSYFNVDGDGDKAGEFTITTVDIAPNPDSPSYPYTSISVDKQIPRVKQGTVNGGRVSRIYSADLALHLGEYSLATGEFNIAAGRAQTVVGRYNRSEANSTMLSNFMVGVGTSGSDRKNAFEVYPDGYTAYGTPSTTKTLDAVGSSSFSFVDNFVAEKLSTNGWDLIAHGGRMRFKKAMAGYLTGGFELRGHPGQLNEYRLNLNTSGSSTYSRAGGISLVAGDTSFNNIISEEPNAIYFNAVDSITQQTSKRVRLISGTSTELTWGTTLSLTGDTIGALPTSDKAFNHNFVSRVFSTDNNALFGDIESGQGTMSIFNTGFYSTRREVNKILGPLTTIEQLEEARLTDAKLGIARSGFAAGKYHLLNYGYKEADRSDYYNLQFIYGFDPDTDGHIGVRRGKSLTDSAGTSTYFADSASVGENIKRLSWYEDIVYKHPTSFAVAPYTDILPVRDGISDVSYQTDFEYVQDGEWSTIPQTSLEVRLGRLFEDTELDLTGVAYDFDDPESSGYTVYLRYTKISKTLHFELYLTLDNTSLLESTATENENPVKVIAVKPIGAYEGIFDIQTFVPNISYTPSFQSTTYYRYVTNVAGEFVQDKKIYNCHVTEMSGNFSPGVPAGTNFLISTSGSAGAAVSDEVEWRPDTPDPQVNIMAMAILEPSETSVIGERGVATNTVTFTQGNIIPPPAANYDTEADNINAQTPHPFRVGDQIQIYQGTSYPTRTSLVEVQTDDLWNGSPPTSDYAGWAPDILTDTNAQQAAHLTNSEKYFLVTAVTTRTFTVELVSAYDFGVWYPGDKLYCEGHATYWDGYNQNKPIQTVSYNTFTEEGDINKQMFISGSYPVLNQ